MAKEQQDFKKYLDPSVVSKLKSLELKAKMVVEGFIVGLHKSPYHGFSVEFSEHRQYNQGDPIKNIDWKVYGKRDKYFIKQYEEETNLISHVILDVSKSMSYKNRGEISKLEYGKTLAAALVYLMLQQQDAAALAFYSDKIESYLPPKSNRVYLQTLLKALNSVQSSEKTETSSSLKFVAEKVKRSGLIVIISDFFDDIEKVLKSIKNFQYRKNEVIVFQILDPVEIDFSFGKDAIFVDMESKEELTTQPYQIQKSYQSAMKDFLEKMKKECLNSGIEYNLIQTITPFDKALLSYMKKRSRMN